MSTPSSSYNTLIFLRFYYVYISFGAVLSFFLNVVTLSRGLFKSHKENLKTAFFAFLRYKKGNELWEKKTVLHKGKILCFPPLIVAWLMRRAKFTCPCSAVLCLSMWLNSTGWKKKNHIYRNCPHKCDETDLGLLGDRQVRANLLRSGRLNLEDPFMKTSFKSRCLARGNRTPTDLCVSAGAKRKVAEGQTPECLTCF